MLWLVLKCPRGRIGIKLLDIGRRYTFVDEFTIITMVWFAIIWYWTSTIHSLLTSSIWSWIHGSRLLDCLRLKYFLLSIGWSCWGNSSSNNNNNNWENVLVVCMLGKREKDSFHLLVGLVVGVPVCQPGLLELLASSGTVASLFLRDKADGNRKNGRLGVVHVLFSTLVVRTLFLLLKWGWFPTKALFA